MTRRISLLRSAALALAAVSAAACSSIPQDGVVLQDDDRYGPREGESEITFAGSLSNQMIDLDGGGDLDINTIYFQVAGGYFLDDHQEIGGFINLSSSDTETNGSSFDSQNLGLYPYYRWNFRGEGRGWFYTGGQVGLSFVDTGPSSDSTFGFGIHGGYKHWVRPNMAIFIEPRLNYTDLDIGDLVDFTTLLGLAVTW